MSASKQLLGAFVSLLVGCQVGWLVGV